MHVCTHPRRELRWRNRSANLIAWQCLDCLRVAQINGKSWIPHTEVSDAEKLPEWQQEDAPREDMKVAKIGQLDRQAVRIFDHEYEDYLASRTWLERRARIMRRADGKCEGCGERGPEEVHHLTYAHVFEEFDWELKAVCRPCHERLHHLDQERSKVVR